MHFWSNQGAKAIPAATATTLVWNDAEVSQEAQGLVTFANTVADNDLTAVDSFRIKSKKLGLLWDVTTAIMRSFVESESPNNTIPSTANLRYSLPVGLPGLNGRVGLPGGAGISYEVVQNNTNAAGTSIISGWDIPQPEFYSRFVSFAGNIAASQTGARINLAADGLCYGISLPLVGTTGLTQINRIVLSGVEVCGIMTQLQILETLQERNPLTVITTAFFRLPVPMPVTTGNSFIELNTGAGALATDQYALFMLNKI